MSRSSPWLAGSLVLLLCGEADVARAEPASSTRDATSECRVREVEYALSARIRLSDTPFGAGDGIHKTGPGRLVLRLTSAATPAAYDVELIDYELRGRFTVRSKVLFWSARVSSQTESRVAPGVAARGKLAGRKLSWSTPVQGYRTDGTITCSGSGCGMPGAPPEGQSPLHIGPSPVEFAPFTFARDDLETFVMEYTHVSRTKQPKQTSQLALGGRKVRERCVGE